MFQSLIKFCHDPLFDDCVAQSRWNYAAHVSCALRFRYSTLDVANWQYAARATGVSPSPSFFYVWEAWHGEDSQVARLGWPSSCWSVVCLLSHVDCESFVACALHVTSRQCTRIKPLTEIIFVLARPRQLKQLRPAHRLTFEPCI